MSEDHIRSVFEIDYTRWILTTLLGLLLYLTPEICSFLSIEINEIKSTTLEYFGFTLVVTSIAFLIKFPNWFVNMFMKNALQREREINRVLRTRLKECMKKIQTNKIQNDI
ncbi:hypothetical protein [Desulfovibrio falkowii]|uniref:Uncharacterized protein n=1 Tax=Desulfovibrio falkowii TaxID=3136602 RepID=A0ABQ0E5S8_9BACT